MPVNPWSLAPFKTVRKHKIPPNPEGVVSAFSRIGYSLEEAVADVIDNAIDAEADNVLIRFFMGGLPPKKESSCNVRLENKKGGNRWSKRDTHRSRLSVS